MSTRLKLNVKHITLGFQNFSDVFAHESRIYNGFSRLVVPMSIPLRRPDCKYYKQDYVKRSTLNFAKHVLPQTADKTFLKRTSSGIPLTGKWLDTVYPGPICAPGSGFPWVSTYSFYYDTQNPQCPPPNPKPRSDSESCKKSKPHCRDKLRLPPKGDTSCKKKTKSETNPCTRKLCTFTIPLKTFRFYSVKACTPKGGDSDKPTDCKPKPCQPRSESKAKGPICPPPKKMKDCPPKGKKRTGSICPPRKETKDCPPKGRKRKASVCGPMKKKPKCPPKGRKSSAGPICAPKSKRGSSKGGRCESKCRPVLKKPRSCTPESSKPKSACGPKAKPKKPKC